MSFSTDKSNALSIREFSVTNSKCEKPSGIKNDSQLSFENKFESIC